MSKDYFNGKRIGYQITYYPVDWENKLSFFVVNYTKNFAELINLTAFTTYVINVSAVSSGGVGPGKSSVVQTEDAGKKKMV